MKELQIKAALIDFILKTRNPNEICISHEVRFNDSNRRADLVCLGKHLEAFEIKSKYDSVATLKDQINDYQKCFEKTSVVTAQNHLTSVLKLCPKSVGILVIDESDEITEFRKPSTRKRLSKQSLLRMIKGKDINQKLRALGKNLHSDDINTKRNKLSSRLNLAETLDFAKSSLWNASSKQFRSFLNERGKVTNVEDLYLLSQTPWNTTLQDQS